MTRPAARLRYFAGRLRAATRRGRPPRVVIIGAGFGGIAAAVALRGAGIDDLVIIEGADGVGGTWRRNTYPGAACDIQSHLYSFSFAPNKFWSRTYARQPEILAYLESVVDDFDLRRHLMLSAMVRSIRWDEDTWGWVCQVDRAGGDRYLDRRRGGVCDWLVRAAQAARHRRADRFRWHVDAHRRLGSPCRFDGKTGGGDRHRGQRGAGRPRTGEARWAPDGISAHPTLDGSQGRSPLHRNRIEAVSAQPAGNSADPLADLEVPA
nr:Cyclohexanone monooxygenase [Mycobacterium pseudoshottsii]